jgi:type I restriction enzyme S subunit
MAAPLTTRGQKTIPTPWQEKILKRDFEVVLGKMLQPEQRNELETEEYYLRSANVQWEGIDVSDVKTMWFSPREKEELRLRSGDLVVNEGGDVGRCATWAGELEACYFQNAVNRVRPLQKACARFLYYWLYNLKHAGFIDAVVSRTTIAHLTAEKLEAMPWAAPPPHEQQHIAAYLDASCAAIETAIKTKEKQIEIFSNLRQSIIQKAVTQGLNPKAKMSSTEVEWIPSLPHHWKKVKLKRYVEMLRGQFSHRPRNDPAYYDGPYPFIQTGSISAVDKFITEYSQTLNELGLSVSKMFPSGTIVMTITGAKIAEVAVTTFDACFPDSIVGFVPNHDLHKDYLFYVLMAMKPALLGSMIVTTQPNINYVQIGGNYIPLPPLSEQEAIVQHVETEVSRIRAIRHSLEDQIASLTAYRRSLIHECVTGQRPITEAEVRAIQERAATLSREPALPIPSA